MLVWLLGQGSFLGIPCCCGMHDDPGAVASTVAEHTELLLLSPEQLAYLLNRNKTFRDHLIQLLYRKLDYIERRKNYSSRTPLRRKLVEALLFMSPSHCPPPEALEGKPYSFGTSPAELAQMLNVSRKELAGVIDELSARNILVTDAGSVTIRQLPKLLRYTK